MAIFAFDSARLGRKEEVKLKLESLVEDGVLDRKNMSGRILDLGVGYGGSFSAFMDYGAQVLGIEPERSVFDSLADSDAIPKGSVVSENPAVYMRKEQTSSYDLVAAVSIFSSDGKLHIEQIKKEALRILRPGGQLIFTVQNDVANAANYIKRIKKMVSGQDQNQFLSEKYKIGPDKFVYVETKI